MNVKGTVISVNNHVTDAEGYAIPPLSSAIEVGQFAVNTSDTDPCIFFKTKTEQIVKIPTEAVLVKALTEILGNSAADLDTLRELLAQFEGSANDILPMIVKLTDRIDAAEKDLTAHTGNRNNPHGVTAAQVGALPSGGTAVNSDKLGGIVAANYYHKDNANLPNVDWICKVLNANIFGEFGTSSEHYYSRITNNAHWFINKSDGSVKGGLSINPTTNNPIWNIGGAVYNMYHSGNSNLSTVNWACNNLNLNNSIRNAGDGTTTFDTHLFSFSAKNRHITIGSGTTDSGKDVKKISIASSGAERITIIENGNVGINNPNPTEMLDVSGNILAANMFIGNATTKNQVWHAGNSNKSDVNWTARDSRFYGTVGIGKAPSQSKLDINGGVDGFDTVYVRNVEAVDGKNFGMMIIAGSNTTDYNFLAHSKANVQLFKISGGGKVKIGTGTALEALDVSGNGKFSGNCYVGGNAGFGTNNPTDRVHAVGNVRATEKLIAGGNVESSGSGIFAGDVVIKKTGGFLFSAGETAGVLRLNDLQDVKIPTDIKEKQVLYYDPAQVNADGTTGGYTFASAVGVGTGRVSAADIDSLPEVKVIGNTFPASDERLKENIRPLRNAMNILLQLNVKQYNWNQAANELGLNEPTAYGLIAQEVEPLRELVDIVKPLGVGDYLGVDYIKIIPILIAAYQEQHEEIVKLNRKLNGITRK